MNKNPFSIFDFFGYFFPGAFACLLWCYCSLEQNAYHTPIEVFNFVADKWDIYNVKIDWLIGVTLVVICYIIGHIVAYVSSLTVERYLIWFYGYPSDFLLYDKKNVFWSDYKDLCCAKSSHWKLAIVRTYVIRFIVIMSLFPIFIVDLIVRLMRLDCFFVKKLDRYLTDVIQYKYSKLKDKMQLPDMNNYSHSDFCRIIYHYEYEKTKGHAIKMDNYVALYDFLRSLTLILNVYAIYLLYVSLGSSFDENVTICVLPSLVAAFLPYLLFMGFFKFYRRFTLESFMALASDDTL